MILEKLAIKANRGRQSQQSAVGQLTVCLLRGIAPVQDLKRNQTMTTCRRIRRSRRLPQQIRSVHVNPYTRFRFGQWESVCEHYRSPPGQLAFTFD